MRRFRLAGYLALDGMILAGALVTALWLRFDGNVPSHYFQRAIDVLPWFVAGGFVIFAGSGLYSGLWQYASIHEAARIGLASLVAGLWLAFLLYFPKFSIIGFPRSVILITVMLVALGVGATRLSERFLRSVIVEARQRDGATRRTLIVGAGDAGAMLLRELLKHGIRPVGFIDDDPEKHGRRIHGVPVLGPRTQMGRVPSSV